MVTEELKISERRLNRVLRSFFQREMNHWVSASSVRQVLMQLRRYVLSGGKRLRPTLALWAYEAVGGRNFKEMEKAALALELAHVYLLVHDDIMDRDALRHGGETIHTFFARHAPASIKLVSERAHYGQSMAIVAGDAANALAVRCLATVKFPAARVNAALRLVAQSWCTTAAGQLLDIFSATQAPQDAAAIRKIHWCKTAVYTLETPLLVGALLAGATPAKCRLLSRYAIPLGIAFQIQDDLLGAFADERKIGKPVGSDLRERKQTLLISYVRHRAAASEWRKLKAIWGKANLTKAEVEVAREIFRRSGALRYSVQTAQALARQSLRVINSSPALGVRGRGLLAELARYIIERQT